MNCVADDDETPDAIAGAPIAVAEAKVLTTEAAILAANKLFELDAAPRAGPCRRSACT